jgi:RNA polymerase sigma-70 factor, ECF subfamily
MASGEPAASREMLDRKLPRVLALAQRILGSRAEAEDVAQEALLRTWRQAGTWRTGEARLDTWLHRVVVNLCADRLRSLRRRKETAPQDLPEAVDPAPTPPESRDRSQVRARVAAAVSKLPARQREALVLFHYQELSHADAAAVMGISVDALESLLARARRNLRQQLAGIADPQ